jgi:hypothetical protein
MLYAGDQGGWWQGHPGPEHSGGVVFQVVQLQLFFVQLQFFELQFLEQQKEVGPGWGKSVFTNKLRKEIK